MRRTAQIVGAAGLSAIFVRAVVFARHVFALLVRVHDSRREHGHEGDDGDP